MTALLIVHILISIALIVLVFVQYGRGGDMGASMGGGGSANSVFGASGSADFISKLTGVVGLLFFASALAIGAVYKQSERSGGDSGGLMQDYAPKPVAPAVQEKSSAIPVQSSVPQPNIPADKVKAIPVGQTMPAVAPAKPVGATPVVPHQVAPSAKEAAPAAVNSVPAAKSAAGVTESLPVHASSSGAQVDDSKKKVK